MLIFGIDKFMSECRALVNFIGNAVATLFVAKWNNELDVTRARAVFAGKDVEPLFDPSEDLDVNPYDPADHELVGANHGATGHGRCGCADSRSWTRRRTGDQRIQRRRICQPDTDGITVSRR